MVNFGPFDTVPQKFAGRNLYKHNPTVTLMRTTADENREVGEKPVSYTHLDVYKRQAMGGADLLLALSAGKFRIMGRSSFSSYLCYGDSNTIVMDMGCNELLPIIRDTPCLLYTSLSW